MAENILWPQVDLTEAAEATAKEATILVHGTRKTPHDDVIPILRSVFELSDELAEHIAWVVRATGAAPVVTRPRTKAEHLVREAQAAARLVGNPCAFSVASKPYPEKTDTPRIAIPIILTLIPLLSAAAVAIADGAGGL